MIVEIGAGTGVLTKGLAGKAARVVAVEIDHELVVFLEKAIKSVSNVRILCLSILDLDLRQVAAEYAREKLIVVGNLPYHLTTQVILHLIEHQDVILHATIMVQKEYADRLLAAPGGRDYGAISLRTAYSADVTRIVNVPSAAFYPRPKVDSTVLKLAFRTEPPVDVTDEGFLFTIIRSTFNQRRKMLVNSLSILSRLEKEEVKAVCRSIAVDPDRRPETLSLEEFARLANAFHSRK